MPGHVRSDLTRDTLFVWATTVVLAASIAACSDVTVRTQSPVPETSWTVRLQDLTDTGEPRISSVLIADGPTPRSVIFQNNGVFYEFLPSSGESAEIDSSLGNGLIDVKHTAVQNTLLALVSGSTDRTCTLGLLKNGQFKQLLVDIPRPRDTFDAAIAPSSPLAGVEVRDTTQMNTKTAAVIDVRSGAVVLEQYGRGVDLLPASEGAAINYWGSNTSTVIEHARIHDGRVETTSPTAAPNENPIALIADQRIVAHGISDLVSSILYVDSEATKLGKEYALFRSLTATATKLWIRSRNDPIVAFDADQATLDIYTITDGDEATINRVHAAATAEDWDGIAITYRDNSGQLIMRVITVP